MCYVLLCCASLCPVLFCCVFLLSTGVVCSSKAGPRHPVLVEHSAHNTVYGTTRNDVPRHDQSRLQSVDGRPVGGEEQRRERLGTEALSFCKSWGEGDDRRVIVKMTLEAKY